MSLESEIVSILNRFSRLELGADRFGCISIRGDWCESEACEIIFERKSEGRAVQHKLSLHRFNDETKFNQHDYEIEYGCSSEQVWTRGDRISVDFWSAVIDIIERTNNPSLIAPLLNGRLPFRPNLAGK